MLDTAITARQAINHGLAELDRLNDSRLQRSRVAIRAALEAEDLDLLVRVLEEVEPFLPHVVGGVGRVAMSEDRTTRGLAYEWLQLARRLIAALRSADAIGRLPQA